MKTTEVINFRHVESMKLRETTVCVRFASGEIRTFEFSESAEPANMILTFENWCNMRHSYGGYVVHIGEDGKAEAR